MEHPSASPEEALSRGLALVPQLRQVAPEDAPEPIRYLYAEVMEVLRSPTIDLLFRTLANDPRYLARAWRGVMPLARTTAFEDAADVLRAEAVLPEITQVDAGRWAPPQTLERIRQLTDTVHYVAPKVLLIAQAFAAPNLAVPGDAATLGPTVARGIPKGSVDLEALDRDSLEARGGELLETVRQSRGHAQLATWYAALAQWPAFFTPAWSILGPLGAGVPYLHARGRIGVLARELLRGLPWDPVRPSGTEIDVPAVLAVFTHRLLPDLLLDVATLKAMLDGPEAAKRSTFSGMVQV